MSCLWGQEYKLAIRASPYSRLGLFLQLPLSCHFPSQGPEVVHCDLECDLSLISDVSLFPNGDITPGGRVGHISV